MNEDRRAIEQDYLFQQLSTAETERAFRFVDQRPQVSLRTSFELLTDGTQDATDTGFWIRDSGFWIRNQS